MRALHRLVRLPNVFTALADIVAGYFLASASDTQLGITAKPGNYFVEIRWDLFALLCAVSAALYLAGMALNDYADREEDARIRPERPIPSGAVTPALALGVGLGLLAAGTLLALLVGRASALCAAMLALAICAYDFLAKGRTFAGPLTLGICRAANILLGMSVAYNGAADFAALGETRLWTLPWLPALASGLYGAGVTAFSAQEEQGKSRFALILGWIFVVLGLSAAAAIFWQRMPGEWSSWDKYRFVPLIALAFQLINHTRALRRTGSPDSARALVLAGVKGYCLLDAAMLLVYGGLPLLFPALLALFLLLPGGWLRKWLAQREA